MTRFMAATSAAHWCELVARRELRSECRTFRSTSPCAGRQATSVRRPASTPTRHRFVPIDPERVSDLVETRSSVKGALSYLDDDSTALPVRENPLDSKNVRLVAFATRDTRYAGKSLSERLCIAGA